MPASCFRFLVALLALGTVVSASAPRVVHTAEARKPRESIAALPEARAALPAQSPANLRIAVMSDLNSSYGSMGYDPAVTRATAALLEHVQPELVLITGDMVAGQKRGLQYAAMWRSFHGVVTTPLVEAGIPVAPTPGNHDASPFAEFAPERTEYVQQWRAAERTPPVTFIDRTHYPLRYSFVHRGAWFVSLDAAAAGPLSVEQRRWVETQLSRGADYRIKIAFGHLPVYATARQRELEVVSDSALEALFEEHRVTAYVSGHHHAYYPGAARGMRHVSMPCLGAGARRLLGVSRRSERALVVLDVKNDELVSVEALRAPEFEASIKRSELPPSVAHRNRILARDDLSGFSSAVLEFPPQSVASVPQR